MYAMRMKQVIRKYFIPYQENDHQPHLLRLEKTLFIIGAIVLIEAILLSGVFFVFPSFEFFAAIHRNILVDETNTNRANAAIAPLTANPLLEKAAKLKADDMAAKGYFAHTSPDGITPWFWFEASGYEFSAAGENLAVNFFDSKDVAEAWMNSPSHRANILNHKFTEIGVATANGMYKGKEAVFVVQLFGRPLSASRQAPLPPQGEVQNTKSEHELFIELPGIEIQTAQAQVPRASAQALSSLFERLIGAPRGATTFVYVALASIIGLALMLKMFIRANIQYPRLIVNGIFVLIAIASSLLLNYYIALQTHIV